MAHGPLTVLVHRFKALGHPARLRLAAMLALGELCVCQMTALLKLAPSTVSAHVAELRRAGLVGERKEGRWVFYNLTTAGRALLDTLLNEIGSDPLAVADAVLSARLRAVGPEELCRVGLDVRRLEPVR